MMQRKIVYTAFDGDDMIHIEDMRELAIRNNCIPINPEQALGYYVSTYSHNDLKYEVMKDCLSLVRMSNEFWIFVNRESDDRILEVLPEGVLIEIILWIKIGGTTLRIFSIPKMTKSFRNDSIYKGEEVNIELSDIKEITDSEYFSEIINYLEDVFPVLRPVVFVDIQNKDLKYIDWVRIYSYKSLCVPIVPQLTIPEMVYNRHSLIHRRDSDLETIKERVSSIWVVFKSRKEQEEIKLEYKRFESKLIFLPIHKLGIPKYTNPANWSITTQEYVENIDILK